MKQINSILILSVLLFIAVTTRAQDDPFNIDEYKAFLQQHQNMQTSELLQMFPAGTFEQNINSNWSSALYSDSVEIKLNLTIDELQKINDNGFVVTERISKNSFGEHFLDIYHHDLPVFISTDAILHALHMSYDNILLETELGTLLNKVETLLNSMHAQMPVLAARYSSNPEMAQMLKDVDVYLSVPLKLLDENHSPYNVQNESYINTLLNYINSEQLIEIPFLSTSNRKIDFSQFKPRGHYDSENFPMLKPYFQAMIWLGRMEIYLIAPTSFSPVPFEDIQRQIVDAVLLNELIELANVEDQYEQIEEILEYYVGEQDNVKPENLNGLLNDLSITYADEILDENTCTTFQDSLAEKSFAFQRILSQVLVSPMTPDSIVPASAYLLFGQRFVIDSYVTGSVVFDRIKYLGQKIKRMLPSSLDILFALGNDASAQLLQNELDEYHYSTNLAALRYLVDSYDDQFWNSSIYNLWLNSIRELNPPNDRSNLPTFMQTAAWWQQKMNTQLSSWIQLRHDNLLYAKQSYSGGVICSYPYGYVEPIPEFYAAIKTLSEECKIRFNDFDFSEPYLKVGIINYFEKLSAISDTLHSIAQKELSNVPFSNAEISFLKRIIYEAGMGGCGSSAYDGWYPKLFYPNSGEDNVIDMDFLTADYHTAPTDEFGSPVGWIKHGGTGKINLAIFSAELPGGQNTAFVGPVNSFHEYTSTNFFRINDQEWEAQYLGMSTRPEWANNFLIDSNGIAYNHGPSLLTGIKDDETETELPITHIVAQNYPNPFNATTIINFKIPLSLTNSLTEITIYDINGEKVKTLLKETLPSGNYLTRWDGTNNYNSSAASGVYFYHVSVGAQKFVGKMSLLK